MKNIKIFTAFHKDYELPQDEYHIPVHVGKAKSNIKLPFIGDDTGDNISLKNPNYCELTMLYRVWKNYDLHDTDYIGLAHYRRIFNIKNIVKKINHYDIIVPFKIISEGSLFISLESQYKHCHIPEDFDTLKNVLYALYPEYKEYDYIFTKKHLFFMRGCFYNMFIMKKKLFFDYCEWLFHVLFEYENKVQISIYPYQARIFGFIGERLFNIWLEKEKVLEKKKVSATKLIYL